MLGSTQDFVRNLKPLPPQKSGSFLQMKPHVTFIRFECFISSVTGLKCCVREILVIYGFDMVKPYKFLTKGWGKGQKSQKIFSGIIKVLLRKLKRSLKESLKSIWFNILLKIWTVFFSHKVKLVEIRRGKEISFCFNFFLDEFENCT